MPPSLSQKEWIRELATTDMMAIEAIVSEVCARKCQGLSDFALFDGGAHSGYHTIRMASLPGCEAVYAVEADPTMAEGLEKIVAKAKRQGGFPKATEFLLSVKALQGDQERDCVTWKSSTSHIGRSSIASTGERKTIWNAEEKIVYREDITVEATTIDKLLASERRPLPFLKLDLEGADITSLFGGRETLKNKRPIVAFENSVHAPKVHGFTIEEFIRFLEGIDYVATDFFGNRLELKNWFTFFEAWLTPVEDADWLAGALNAAVRNQSHKVEATFPGSLEAESVIEPFSEGVPDAEKKLDPHEISEKIAEVMWSSDHRPNQPVEHLEPQNENGVPSEDFMARVRQVVRTLSDEGLHFRQEKTSWSDGYRERQWMLDSGRFSWLMWLGARRASHEKDESLERELWSNEADQYRDYARAGLQNLQKLGIIFASPAG